MIFWIHTIWNNLYQFINNNINNKYLLTNFGEKIIVSLLHVRSNAFKRRALHFGDDFFAMFIDREQIYLPMLSISFDFTIFDIELLLFDIQRYFLKPQFLFLNRLIGFEELEKINFP